GKPIAGVTVRVEDLRWPKQGDLTAWLAALDAQRQDGYATEHQFLTGVHAPELGRFFPAVVTGADGRVQLQGIGRERLAGLVIEGPTSEYKRVRVRTRPGATIEALAWKYNPEGDKLTYHGATFDHPAAPSVPIVGVVRDKDTGKPLAGVTVQSDKFAD